MIAIPKGTKITCPGCGDHIATMTKDAEYGDRIAGDIFKWENQRFEFGDKTTCKKCGDYWCMSAYQQGKVHTENGWLP